MCRSVREPLVGASPKVKLRRRRGDEEADDGLLRLNAAGVSEASCALPHLPPPRIALV